MDAESGKQAGDDSLLAEGWSPPSFAELHAHDPSLASAMGAPVVRPGQRRRRRHRVRHSARSTPNRFGHCPADPRRFRPWNVPAFLRPGLQAHEAAYFARGTNADPHPALLLRAKPGTLREARRLGKTGPVLLSRKRVRSDLRESQDLFAQFILKHVDLDSHAVGKPPNDQGHIVPYSLGEMLDAVRQEIVHLPNAILTNPDSSDGAGHPRAYFSLSTLCRRIRDFRDAGYIVRWQHREYEAGEDGQDDWDGFVANMRVTRAFFRALGYTDKDLKEEALRRRAERGYKTEISPPVHSPRYEAFLQRQRAEGHRSAHERANPFARQLISRTVDVCLTANATAAEDPAAATVAAEVLELVRRQPGGAQTSTAQLRRAVQHKLRVRRPPRPPP